MLRGAALTVAVLTLADNGRTVAARVGDVLDVQLPENATAGFRWRPAPAPAREGVLAAESAGASYRAGATGSGGVAAFRIRVAAPGTATLRLRLGRSWEGAAIQEFAVTVEAR